jgi:hypothetical protein
MFQFVIERDDPPTAIQKKIDPIPRPGDILSLGRFFQL